MVLIRLVLLISALLIIASFGAYVFTRDTRYLAFARQVTRFIVFALLVFGALFLLERYGLVAWRVLV
jgi:hypothetical protein